MKATALHIVLMFVWATAIAQPAERMMSREEYIEVFKDEAIKEMLETGIPASITLAQGMLESGNGNSPLARYANNHFGIKCHNTWDGPTFIQDDDAKNECFRKYRSPSESFKDHSEFLKTRSRYASLFELQPTDYKAWAKGLKQAGYATNPKYPELLIQLIEDNSLHQYDKESKMPLLASHSTKKHHPEVEKKHTSSSNSLLVENNIKYVIAGENDSYYKIAEENEMSIWQLYKYNEVEKTHQPKEGEVVYLQPKRKKAKVENHTVLPGETLFEVSQKYGIKTKRILKLNGLSEDAKLKTGQVLILK